MIVWLLNTKTRQNIKWLRSHKWWISCTKTITKYSGTPLLCCKSQNDLAYAVALSVIVPHSNYLTWPWPLFCPSPLPFGGSRSWVLLADQRGIEPTGSLSATSRTPRYQRATRMTNMAMTSWICAVWGVKPSKVAPTGPLGMFPWYSSGSLLKFGKLPDLGPPGVLAPPKLGHALVQSAAQTFCWESTRINFSNQCQTNSFFRSQKMNSTIFFDSFVHFVHEN